MLRSMAKDQKMQMHQTHVTQTRLKAAVLEGTGQRWGRGPGLGPRASLSRPAPAPPVRAPPGPWGWLSGLAC